MVSYSYAENEFCLGLIYRHFLSSPPLDQIIQDLPLAYLTNSSLPALDPDRDTSYGRFNYSQEIMVGPENNLCNKAT